MEKYNVDTRKSIFMDQSDLDFDYRIGRVAYAMSQYVRSTWMSISINIDDFETKVEDSVAELCSRLRELFLLNFSNKNMNLIVTHEETSIGYKIELIVQGVSKDVTDKVVEYTFTLLTNPTSNYPILLNESNPTITWRISPFYQKGQVESLSLYRVDDHIYIPIEYVPGMTEELQELYDEALKRFRLGNLLNRQITTDKYLTTTEIFKEVLALNSREPVVGRGLKQPTQVFLE